MINTDMRTYNYFTFGEKNEYGEAVLSENPQGTVNMSINSVSQNISDNPNYADATYIGLTRAQVNNTYVIDYDGVKLKVLYVNPRGRMKQVFMAET